jgi:ribosomal protein L37E
MPSSNSELTAQHTLAGTTVEAPPPQEILPSCRTCGTDSFLIYSAYTPDGVGPDGYVRPAHTSYACTRCGRGDEHDVPSQWKPPGWFCCT